MTRRRTRDDGRGPRRFDPDQRGRDFPNKRKRRGRPRENQTVERRITDLETWSHQSTHVAIQTPSASRIEVVSALPEPSPLDIGRQLIVRSPAAVRDILYIGMQQSDGSVSWVQWTSSYEGGGTDVGNENSIVRMTFVKHIQLGESPLSCCATTDYVYYTPDNSTLVKRVSRATGAITTPVAGFPGVVQGRGLYAQDDGKIWVAMSTATGGDHGSGGIKHWNGTSVVTYSDATTGFLTVTLSPVDGKIYAGGGSGVFLDTNFHRRRHNASTLAQEARVNGSGGSAFAAFGSTVAADGSIYWAHKFTMVQTNTALDAMSTFNGDESIYDNVIDPFNPDFDSNGHLFVPDRSRDRIHVFTVDGVTLGVFGVGGTGPGEFDRPRAVTIDGDTMWIADYGNKRLSEWTIDF